MSVADFLGVLADAATVVLFAVAATAAFAGTRSFLARVLGRLHKNAAARAVADRDDGHAPLTAAARDAVNGAIATRLDGGAWYAADEIEKVVHTACSSKDPAGWPGIDADRAREAYADLAVRLQRDPFLRIGSPALVEAETRIAREVRDVFLDDARYSPAPRRAIECAGSAPLLALLAAEARTHVLEASMDASGTALSHHFSSVRVTLLDRVVGPTGRLARDSTQDALRDASSWNTDEVTAARLADRCGRVASSLAGDPLSYNGRLLRLRDWRAEISGEHSQSRLHLLCEQTTYVALRATNGGLTMELPSDAQLAAEEHEWVKGLALQGGSLRQPWQSPLANALSIGLSLLTSDGKLLLVRRAARSTDAAGRVSCAANGLVELAARPEDRAARGDYGDGGLVDPVQAAIRETHEELGTHLALTPDRVLVRALAVSDEAAGETNPKLIGQRSPWLVLEARTPATLDEVVRGYFANASLDEGAFETDGEFIALPAHGSGAMGSIAWLREEWGRSPRSITVGGVAASLLTYASAIGQAETVNAWRDTSVTPIEPMVINVKT